MFDTSRLSIIIECSENYNATVAARQELVDILLEFIARTPQPMSLSMEIHANRRRFT